jgi:hypothetical protein
MINVETLAGVQYRCADPDPAIEGDRGPNLGRVGFGIQSHAYVDFALDKRHGDFDCLCSLCVSEWHGAPPDLFCWLIAAFTRGVASGVPTRWKVPEEIDN